MRFYVFFVLCLSLNNILAQTFNQNSTLDCKHLSKRVQYVKESTKSKKDKFSCILNLLKNALIDELDRRNESDPVNTESNIEAQNIENNLILEFSETTINNSIENVDKDANEKDIFSILVAKTDKRVCQNESNWDFPTMIPILKPKPVTTDVIAASQQLKKRDSIQNNPKQIHTQMITNDFPAFTIPCQRASDILDMSVTPREPKILPTTVNLETKEKTLAATNVIDMNIPKELIILSDVTDDNTNNQINKPQRHINLQFKDVLPIEIPRDPKIPNNNKLDALGIPKTLSVNCVDSDDSIAVLFNPKAITLEQLYGNLLKKITITVLVPYHMSKIKKNCEVL